MGNNRVYSTAYVIFTVVVIGLMSAPVANASSKSSDDESIEQSEIARTKAAIKSLAAAIRTLSQEERETRLAHAHELLGKYYEHSVVRNGEQIKKIDGMIYRWTLEALPKPYKKQYKKVAKTIIEESFKHDFDPVFLMAVITNESSFIPTQVGKFGEIGLMQLRPGTGKWVADRERLKWQGKKSLRDPITNIKLGAAYLAYLRERFDSQARLYLAAYNMGQGNVEDALERKIWPKDYPVRVMQHYIDYYAKLDNNDN